MQFSTVNTIKCLTLMELDLGKQLTAEEIRSQYRKLCLVYHPDQSNDRYKDGNKFKELKDAQEYLTNNLDLVNKQIRTNFSSENESYSYHQNNYDEERIRKAREAAEKARREKEAEKRARQAAEAEEKSRCEKEAEEREKADKRKQHRKLTKEQKILSFIVSIFIIFPVLVAVAGRINLIKNFGESLSQNSQTQIYDNISPSSGTIIMDNWSDKSSKGKFTNELGEDIIVSCYYPKEDKTLLEFYLNSNDTIELDMPYASLQIYVINGNREYKFKDITRFPIDQTVDVVIKNDSFSEWKTIG